MHANNLFLIVPHETKAHLAAITSALCVEKDFSEGYASYVRAENCFECYRLEVTGKKRMAAHLPRGSEFDRVLSLS